jgi:hypothetical protein
MYVGKNRNRLETDIQKLNSIINELVQENYLLKQILDQTIELSQPVSNIIKKNKRQNL